MTQGERRLCPTGRIPASSVHSALALKVSETLVRLASCAGALSDWKILEDFLVAETGEGTYT